MEWSEVLSVFVMALILVVAVTLGSGVILQIIYGPKHAQRDEFHLTRYMLGHAAAKESLRTKLSDEETSEVLQLMMSKGVVLGYQLPEDDA